MKKSIFIYICFFISLSAFAKKPEDFKKLIKQTNAYFAIYEKLSPFGGECFTYKQLDLTKEDAKQLIKNNYGDDAYTLDQMDDSIMCSDVAIQVVQSKIVTNIHKIIAHKDFKKCDITKLLTSNELRIVGSEDNKLYNFSFDAKNGGTYRMQISIMHYTDYDLDQMDSLNTEDTGNSEPDFVFADDGYNNIYTIYTSEGTKYVLMGFVQGCSSCYGSYISLITFRKNKFVEEFKHSTYLRSGEGIAYDPGAKTISVNYQTDDLTTDCVCENAGDENKEESQQVTKGDVDEQGRVDEVILETEEEVLAEEDDIPVTRQCSCTFVFDGKTFQLRKKSSTIIETE